MRIALVGVGVVCLAALIALMAGCASIIGASAGGELSENLAVDFKGATANDPLFNDGNVYTSATTRSPLAARDDENWMEAEKYTVAEITLPEPTRVHKIKVKTKDLDQPLQRGMWVAVEYMTLDDEWKTIRKWDRNPIPRNPTVNSDVMAKAVRLRVKRPPTLFSGGGAGGDNTDTGERTVYEVEVYQYIPKDEAAVEEG